MEVATICAGQANLRLRDYRSIQDVPGIYTTNGRDRLSFETINEAQQDNSSLSLRTLDPSVQIKNVTGGNKANGETLILSNRTKTF